MVQIQKLQRQVFEFVQLLDDKVQEKFLENFSGGPKYVELIIPETDVGSTKQMCSYWVYIPNTNFS